MNNAQLDMLGMFCTLYIYCNDNIYVYVTVYIYILVYMYNVSLLMDGLSLNIFDDIAVYYMVISHMVWLISNHVTLRYYFFTKYTKLFDTIGFSI